METVIMNSVTQGYNALELSVLLQRVPVTAKFMGSREDNSTHT